MAKNTQWLAEGSLSKLVLGCSSERKSQPLGSKPKMSKPCFANWAFWFQVLLYVCFHFGIFYLPKILFMAPRWSPTPFSASPRELREQSADNTWPGLQMGPRGKT